ncbi:MAG: polysaccharide export protein [Pseudomonadales bacterium]|nr:polysaccharide export protein [Pseudomonadales bacterium]
MRSLCFLLMFTLINTVSAADASLSDYRLGVGDAVRITVFGQDDLDVEGILTDAGTISYPFLGEIPALGLTVGQLEQLVHHGLKGDYLVNPSVSVAVVEYRKFFVDGEVKQPGSFSYSPGMTLRKAIALAGGFTERASRKKISVIREDMIGEMSIVLEDEVFPGDIITVNQSFF